MQSLQDIRSRNRDAAVRHACINHLPLIIEKEDIEDAQAGNFTLVHILPFVGAGLPDGWERVDLASWYGPGEDFTSHVPNVDFGDNDGHGAFKVTEINYVRTDMGMTPDELVGHARAGYAYAVVAPGPFQYRIGVFERSKK